MFTAHVTSSTEHVVHMIFPRGTYLTIPRGYLPFYFRSILYKYVRGNTGAKEILVFHSKYTYFAIWAKYR